MRLQIVIVELDTQLNQLQMKLDNVESNRLIDNATEDILQCLQNATSNLRNLTQKLSYTGSALLSSSQQLQPIIQEKAKTSNCSIPDSQIEEIIKFV